MHAISNSFFIWDSEWNGTMEGVICEFEHSHGLAMGRFNRELVRLIKEMQAILGARLCRIIFRKSAAPTRPPTGLYVRFNTTMRCHFPMRLIFFNGVEPSHARCRVSFGPLGAASPTTRELAFRPPVNLRKLRLQSRESNNCWA